MQSLRCFVFFHACKVSTIQQNSKRKPERSWQASFKQGQGNSKKGILVWIADWWGLNWLVVYLLEASQQQGARSYLCSLKLAKGYGVSSDCMPLGHSFPNNCLLSCSRQKLGPGPWQGYQEPVMALVLILASLTCHYFSLYANQKIFLQRKLHFCIFYIICMY